MLRIAAIAFLVDPQESDVLRIAPEAARRRSESCESPQKSVSEAVLRDPPPEADRRNRAEPPVTDSFSLVPSGEPPVTNRHSSVPGHGPGTSLSALRAAFKYEKECEAPGALYPNGLAWGKGELRPIFEFRFPLSSSL